MIYIARFCALLTLAAVAGPASAHHALNAFFDLDTPIEIDGTLTSVRWTNPHISFELEGVSPDGSAEVWSVESGSPILLHRAGITSDTFAVGDRVTITGFPSKLRDGEAVGAIIHMDNGRDLPMFRSLALRLGYEPSVSGSHIDTSAAEAGAREAHGIFRVWTFEEDPGAEPFEPEFNQAAINARTDYDPLVDDPALSCTPRGMPFAMENRFPIEFIEQDDAIVLHLEMWNSSRTIDMRGERPDGPTPPSPLGYSEGRWEGDTLVVETTGIDWPYFDELGTPQSAAIETVERFALSDDESVIDYQIAISDPGTLLEPAVRHARWVWVPGEEIQEYGCTVRSGG